MKLTKLKVRWMVSTGTTELTCESYLVAENCLFVNNHSGKVTIYPLHDISSITVSEK